MDSRFDRFEKLNETTLSEETVFEGKVIKCVLRDVELADGRKSKREIVQHNGGCCILPIDSEGNAYVVHQFRSPFGEVLTEIPAGKLELGEDPYECAVRELEEETGFKSGKIIPLGKMISSPGYCSEVIYMYLALDLEFIGWHLDEGEFVNVSKIPFEELLKMVDNDEISDGKSCLCILKAAGRLKDGV